jgi:hypothetical protein
MLCVTVSLFIHTLGRVNEGEGGWISTIRGGGRRKIFLRGVVRGGGVRQELRGRVDLSQCTRVCHTQTFVEIHDLRKKVLTTYYDTIIVMTTYYYTKYDTDLVPEM